MTLLFASGLGLVRVLKSVYGCQLAQPRCHLGFAHAAVCMFFFNRSTLQCDDILTNQLAAITHVIARETQIFQCAAIN